jgi:ABC-type bacteriocin/lantibiotic exporter with double-glycine peptidase domain
MIPSFGINIIKNDKKMNYLYMSDEIYLSQSFNDCAPYSVMCVINILKGEIIDPNILVKETRWRIWNNLTFPDGAIDLLHKYKIKTKEYSLKLYSADDKIMWLKNKIDNGYPIILLVKDKSVQHFFTVIGYDETGFMLYDSVQEKIHEYSRKTIIDRIDYMGNRYYTNEELLKLWNNGGYKIFFRNWAIVCY